jgi:hypothetical protein
MRYELQLHRLLLPMMITLLVLFVIALFYLNPQPGGEHLEAVVSLVVVIIVATIFAYLGAAEGILAFYLGVSTECFRKASPEFDARDSTLWAYARGDPAICSRTLA